MRCVYELMVPVQMDRPVVSATTGAGATTDRGNGSVSRTILVNGAGSCPDGLLPGNAAFRPGDNGATTASGSISGSSVRTALGEGPCRQGISFIS